MNRSVATKMGISSKMRAFFVNAPTDALETIDVSGLELESNLQGEFDYIHLFAQNQAFLHESFPMLKMHLKQTGMLWVSWPKGKRQGTDLSLGTVIKTGYEYGLVESKCLSIDAVWSALKFTYPVEGKIYTNSYGKLNLL